MRINLFSSLTWGHRFSVLLIVFVALIAYSNTFDAPFQFDDYLYIINNGPIKDISHLWSVSEDSREFYDLSHLIRIRFVGFLTFAVNYALHGFDVRGYHVANILIHILNASILYGFVIVTFSTPRLNGVLGSSRLKQIALLAALLFVSHPVQTEAVTYITQRFASLVALFYLLSLLSYAKWRIGRAQAEVFPAKGLYVLSVLCAFLAVKTKENAFTLPVIVALYEFMFFDGIVKRRISYFLPHIIVMAVLPLTLMNMEKPFGAAIAEATRTELSISRWEYFITQFSVLVTYMRLLLFPVNQNLDYDYQVFDSFTSVEVLASFLFLAVMFCLGLYAFKLARRNHPVLRVAAFGIFWFFITISVESSIFSLSDVIFEHRLYMPSVGIMLAAISGTLQIVKGDGKKVVRTLVLSFFVILLMVFSSATYARNAVWNSEVGLWEDVVKKSPRKARGHVSLGKVYEKQGLLDRALEQGEIAVALEPDYAKAHYNLGNVYGFKGRLDKAVEHYTAALKLKPDYVKAHNNLGNVYKRMGKVDRAEGHFLEAIEISADYAEAYNNLGIIYEEKGLTDTAMEYYDSAIRLKPDYADAYNNMAVIYLKKGYLDEAIRHFQNAIRYKRNFAEAHFNLALAYRNKGMPEKAEEHFQTALAINPGLLRSR